MIDGQSLKKARSTAYRLLGMRSRTCRQLCDSLAAKGFLPEIIQEIIIELTDTGFLDDSKFAENYIDSRINNKPCGPRYLLAALLKAGVEYDIAARAVSSAVDPDKERSFAMKLVRKAAAQGITERDKVMRMLINKGFNTAVARSAIEEEFGLHLDIML